MLALLFNRTDWGLPPVVQPPSAAGGVDTKRRNRPLFRPIAAPAIAWDPDEDEALLLMIGAL